MCSAVQPGGRKGIAQRFCAGCARGSGASPGRDERNVARFTPLSSLAGLFAATLASPALKRWAIFGRPCGTAAARHWRAAFTPLPRTHGLGRKNGADRWTLKRRKRRAPGAPNDGHAHARRRKRCRRSRSATAVQNGRAVRLPPRPSPGASYASALLAVALRAGSPG